MPEAHTAEHDESQRGENSCVSMVNRRYMNISHQLREKRGMYSLEVVVVVVICVSEMFLAGDARKNSRYTTGTLQSIETVARPRENRLKFSFPSLITPLRSFPSTGCGACPHMTGMRAFHQVSALAFFVLLFLFFILYAYPSFNQTERRPV